MSGQGVVVIEGWSPGMKKVSTTELLQAELGLGLQEAKRVTDAVLEGQLIRLRTRDLASAARLCEQLQQLGVAAHPEEQEQSTIADGKEEYGR